MVADGVAAVAVETMEGRHATETSRFPLFFPFTVLLASFVFSALSFLSRISSARLALSLSPRSVEMMLYSFVFIRATSDSALALRRG